MLARRIAVHLTDLGQPFKKALHTVARLGAGAVQIEARGELKPGVLTRTGLRHVRKMLEDLDLRVGAVSFPTRRGYNVLEDLDRRVKATRDAMRMAHQLGAQVVVNQVGRVPEEAEGSDWSLLLDVLSELGHFGQHEGVMLAAETGSEPASHLARLMDHLPLGCGAVTLNPGNLIVNGFSGLEAAGMLGPYVRHVHARDGVRDLARGRGLEVPLGQGRADFPQLIATLEEHDYRGCFAIQRPNSTQPESELATAVAYLKNMGN